MITSGITNGEVIDPINKLFPLNIPNRVITNAAIVPRITEKVAEIVATFKLVQVACKMILLEVVLLELQNQKTAHYTISQKILPTC